MNEINIKIPLHKFQALMLCYVRETLNKYGISVLICVKDVKEYWLVLNNYTRECIEHDVKFYVNDNGYLLKSDYFKDDLTAWNELADWINDNRSSTSTTGTTAKLIVPVLPVVNLGKQK
ncbi:TPA: hypothetical protein ACPI87_001236 [Haemophilus influenzae]|uniref:hypothetical protein n=1 Tax=Haemophilus influenzae TaxID=727 RepID=UPI000D009F24|nr:hypothetical protein [Haemophilus influenzae]PRI47093.1 hypothetical protein BVZ70_01533 [Haemophilus influenzae]PRJ02948.1 hypothetical protein BV025_00699 [Haemophilus influenzae]PRJ58414.1 hypothetical protein BV094_00893 [Haemophilus influenzae]PRJ59127.1 hypothetical protein BV097_00672 [Haemophilus influenzae]PRJ88934.1 hypothetical protein BV166_01742 [Haemophilus influenzae]